MRLDYQRVNKDYVELRIVVPATHLADITRGAESYGQACQKIRENLEQWLRMQQRTGYRQGRIL